MSENNKPIKKFKVGPVVASIWLNNKNDKEFNSITVDRLFQDSEGNWKSTKQLRVSDLPRVQLALSKCYEHLTMDKNE